MLTSFVFSHIFLGISSPWQIDPAYIGWCFLQFSAHHICECTLWHTGHPSHRTLTPRVSNQRFIKYPNICQLLRGFLLQMALVTFRHLIGKNWVFVGEWHHQRLHPVVARVNLMESSHHDQARWWSRLVVDSSIYRCIIGIFNPPWKLTWQWKFTTFFCRRYIFKWLFFHCHVR